MAFDLKYKNPLDLTKRGIGVSIPFNATNVFPITYTTKDALKVNIINYFLTNPGERYRNPSFGGGLRRFIFEQLSNDNIENIQSDIQEKFNKHFPSVILNDIKILSTVDNPNQLEVTMDYSIPNTDITDKIRLNFN